MTPSGRLDFEINGLLAAEPVEHRHDDAVEQRVLAVDRAAGALGFFAG
ncbi:MAG TPA: hypothetical protein VGH16_01945 [Candidatus Binatia bacterium]